MTETEAKSFPVLTRPPIVEVVCGIVFQPIPALDALTLGVYWGSRAKEFPEKSLLPAIADAPILSFGGQPMRALLVNEDNQFAIQLQHDRFFMNWRSQGRGYPRFSNRHGGDGLLSRTIAEFEKFKYFVQDRFSVNINVTRIELNKVDMLQHGLHFTDLDDLGSLVPLTAVFKNIQSDCAQRELNLTFVEHGKTGVAFVNLLSIGEQPATIRIDARMRCPCADLANAPAVFTEANDVLNGAFFRLIDQKQLTRFGLEGG